MYCIFFTWRPSNFLCAELASLCGWLPYSIGQLFGTISNGVMWSPFFNLYCSRIASFSSLLALLCLSQLQELSIDGNPMGSCLPPGTYHKAVLQYCPNTITILDAQLVRLITVWPPIDAVLCTRFQRQPVRTSFASDLRV